MTQTATTLEQSKILLEIGIKRTTADMRWECNTVGVPTYDSLSPHIYFSESR
jgi:hypothetical protein